MNIQVTSSYFAALSHSLFLLSGSLHHTFPFTSTRFSSVMNRQLFHVAQVPQVTCVHVPAEAWSGDSLHQLNNESLFNKKVPFPWEHGFIMLRVSLLMSQHTYSKLSRDSVKANMDGVFEIRWQGNFWTFLLLVSWAKTTNKGDETYWWGDLLPKKSNFEVFQVFH